MKLALIKKENASFWRSCQSITSNLMGSYEVFCREEGHQYQVFNFTRGGDALESLDLASKIIEQGFDQVVWLDHYPHPESFIRALVGHSNKKNSFTPAMVVHLFGDFILQAPQWKGALSGLENVPLKFVCASHKQKKLVSSLIKSSDCEVEVRPFPVETKTFSFSQKVREEVRKELGFCENEKVFLYTGRLSYQKNIIDLIYAFATYRKSFDGNSRLVFVGPMDDLGVPYLGKEALDGTFYFHWEECLREHQKLLEDNAILYRGNLNHTDLSRLYSACDFFISLSCHNDEDYGMSPAEALCCGLPCVLTDWGGYASFKSYFPNFVKLVPVSMGESRHAPTLTGVVKGMAACELLSTKEREELSHQAQRKLGIDAVAQTLNQLYQSKPKFLGFNKNFHKLCALFGNNPRAPFRGPSGGYSLFYKELYGLYGESSKGEGHGS